ncbi:hypothetical protein [Sunxiuqinia sp. sy24]|uniref:hypothetical protein n=1 Tax=Sunxiuqinia sp. sy24 TaxID=3461495 RepID=UPI00404625FC
MTQTELILSNEALNAKWSIENNSILFRELTNKYDQQSVNLEDITLFAIELEDGNQLTNLDFQLQERPKVSNIVATDSLPTQALRFAGKEISALLIEENGNIAIRWKAQLRNGSNYIRQNIEIKAMKEAIEISKVIFFDGKLRGASYAGSVLGSTIEFKNFFFGLEHPIAHSKALLARSIGSITQAEINISEIIDAQGEYIISVEHAGGAANYNIESVTLLKNGQPIASDKHPLNGAGGSNFYRLMLEQFDTTKQYTLQAELSNPEVATGTFHIHRKTDGFLNFYINREDELVPGKTISEWSVMGVAPEGQERRAFLYYTERERARPYQQFLHYNCWWDITDDGASSFTSKQLIERMHAWNEKFIQPFDIQLNSFVFDDGWDNLDSVWYFDPAKFPNGFAPQAELCKEYNSGIGVWMSPFGGYLEAQRRRIESAHREELETNDRGLSLAGPNYYKRFQERALDMLNNYKVNYFKFDGFGGSNPKYLPDMEAGARLIKTLRQHNPDVFVNITVGSWPSPFWLKYADCTWRGSGDLHMAGKGTRTQKFMTYRDGTLHNNIVNKAPNYPLNSIMTVGIAYANLGHPIKCINDSIDDFKDMVWSSFAAGSALQELYISHDRMKPEFWPVLAEAAKWAKTNESILKDTHWIGGSPINMEVYGFASWSPEKGILSLRNPNDKSVEYELKLNELFELPEKYRGSFSLKSPWKEDENNVESIVGSSSRHRIILKPFQTIILEAIRIKNN